MIFDDLAVRSKEKTLKARALGKLAKVVVFTQVSVQLSGATCEGGELPRIIRYVTWGFGVSTENRHVTQRKK